MKRCIFRSRRRTGRCEFSALLFFRHPVSCMRENPNSRRAAPYEGSLSVTIDEGTYPCFLSSFRINLSAAALLRLDWTRQSRTSPPASTARQRYICLPRIVTNISSKCQRSSGLGLKRRSLFALSLPFIPSAVPTAVRLSGTDIILSQRILKSTTGAVIMLLIPPDRVSEHDARACDSRQGPLRHGEKLIEGQR